MNSSGALTCMGAPCTSCGVLPVGSENVFFCPPPKIYMGGSTNSSFPQESGYMKFIQGLNNMMLAGLSLALA